MRCLSIDLDYIMYPDIDFYNSLLYSPNPTTRWKKMEDNGYKRQVSKYEIDQSNLMFIYNTFLKSIMKCQSCSFGYEHDSILFELEKHTDIELFHIDHHNDYLNCKYTTNEGTTDYDKEYYFMETEGDLDEGNWGAWLEQQGKLKSMHWVGPPEINAGQWSGLLTYASTRSNFSAGIKEEVGEIDYNFDHIYMCLSPQYVPQQHWHYFSMFISAYEELTGKKAVIHIDKYGNASRLKRPHEQIVKQISTK